MSGKDITEKTLESYDDVFADIVNALLFGGEQVVRQECLRDAQTFSQYKADGASVHSQERDVAKYWEDDAIRLSLIGFENQTEPERTMPLRVLGYDGAAYRSQLLGGRGERRRKPVPVVTLVLYFGTRCRWKSPRTLTECLCVNERLRPYVSDYRIHVFELAWLTDEEINRFRGDFKIVVEYLRAKRVGEAEEWSRQRLGHVHEVMDLLRVISNDRMFLEMEEYVSEIQREEGGVQVCEFVQKMKNEGRIDGIAIGRREGRIEGEESATTKIMTLFSKLLAAGKTEDVQKATNDRAYLQKLMDEYQK